MTQEGIVETPIEQTPAPAASGERPAWLPDKFETPEKMAEAYSALETKMGQGGDPPAGDDAGAPAAEETPAPAEGLEIPAPEQGSQEFDFAPFFQAYNDNGSLSPEQYGELKDAGYPQELVDSYITGLQATQSQQANAVFEKFGGAEEYAKVVQWASKNMDKSWLEKFNADVSTGDPNTTTFATEALRSAYLAANGQTPEVQVSGSSSGPGVTPFRSMEELMTAQRDERYKSGDPAYHKEVEARILASPDIFS